MSSLRLAVRTALALCLPSAIAACNGEISFGTTMDSGVVAPPMDAMPPPPDTGTPDTGPPPPPTDGGTPDVGCVETYATAWPWARTKTSYEMHFYTFAAAAQPLPCGNPSPCHSGTQKPYIPRVSADLDTPANLDKAIDELFASLKPTDRLGQTIIPLKFVHRSTADMGANAVPQYSMDQKMFVDALADDPMVHSCMAPALPDAGMAPEDAMPGDGPIGDGPIGDGPATDGPDAGPTDAVTGDGAG